MPLIILQKSANNEIIFGKQTLRRPSRRAERASDSDSLESFGEALREVESIARRLESGSELSFDQSGRWHLKDFGREEAKIALMPPLDIISEFQERTLVSSNRGGWGFPSRPTSFGKRARHTILEAGAICDRELGKNLVEITCTIPGSTREAFKAVADWSGWIMNRLTQICRDRDKSALWFYAWELQKRGALHLHMCIGGSTLDDAVKLAHQIEYQWWECLLELEDKAQVDVFSRSAAQTWRESPQVWQSHVAPVRKSVAAYFSKYIGKGASKGAGKSFRPHTYYPARWWGCSQSLKALIKAERYRVDISCNSKQAVKLEQRISEFLATEGIVSQYEYEFDLGISAQGYALGGGSRTIRYYEPKEFERICSWLQSFIIDICADIGVPDDCIHHKPAVVCSEHEESISALRGTHPQLASIPRGNRISPRSSEAPAGSTQAQPILAARVSEIKSSLKKGGLRAVIEARLLGLPVSQYDPNQYQVTQLSLFD